MLGLHLLTAALEKIQQELQSCVWKPCKISRILFPLFRTISLCLNQRFQWSILYIPLPQATYCTCDKRRPPAYSAPKTELIHTTHTVWRTTPACNTSRKLSVRHSSACCRYSLSRQHVQPRSSYGRTQYRWERSKGNRRLSGLEVDSIYTWLSPLHRRSSTVFSL